MKTLRLVLGILTIILSSFLLLVSCAGGTLATMLEDTNEIENFSLVIATSFFLLTSSITAICTRKSLIGTFITSAMFAITGIMSAGEKFTKDFAFIPFFLATIYFISALIPFIINLIKKHKQKDTKNT